MKDANLIVGIDHPDDAGVYKLTDDLALILTLDFFTPIVDDPYTFGQITVANSLSDVYAMGGTPLVAMNIICFPEKTMDISILQEILHGGVEKMQEAGVLLVGGHSVEDDELKYGLSVTGTVHPKKVLRNSGAQDGDSLILTKPLGTGIISTAIKADLANETAIAKAVTSMKTLNKKPAELMMNFRVNSCTDITGFGLLGHACEMIEGSDVGIEIYASEVPFFTEALEYAKMGLIPGGTYRNEEFRSGMVDIEHSVNTDLVKLLFDAQTSGGLLISLPQQEAETLMCEMHAFGIVEAAIVGRITRENPGRIVISG